MISLLEELSEKQVRLLLIRIKPFAYSAMDVVSHLEYEERINGLEQVDLLVYLLKEARQVMVHSNYLYVFQNIFPAAYVFSTIIPKVRDL